MGEKLRVCILTEFFYPDDTGGTGPVVSDLARRLFDDHGVKIEVITSRHSYRAASPKFESSQTWDGIEIHRVPSPNLNSKNTALRTLGNLVFVFNVLIRLLFSKRYDAVLTTTAPPFLPVAADINRMLRRTPYVYVVYDLEPDRIVGLKLMKPTSPFVAGMKWLQRRWLRRASKVAAIGRCMAHHIERSYDLPKELTAVVPVGSRDIPSLATSESEFRRRHGLSGFVVMYAGNFGRYHDFDTVLKAASSLQAGQSEITFVMVGRGAQRKAVAERVAKEQLHNVRLFDFVPTEEFPDMLAAADVCLVTMESGLEGTCVPSKLYSIMAAARPTVALVAEGSEVALSLNEHRCGFRVVQQNSDALAAALLELKTNYAARLEMGERARTAFEDAFTTDKTAQAFHRLLEKATQRSRKAAVYPRVISAVTIKKAAEEVRGKTDKEEVAVLN